MLLRQIFEKYLKGARAPLYHWTTYTALNDILKLGAIGHASDDGWDPIKGTTKLKKAWVSFTRNKNYAIRGGTEKVRLTFDKTRLQQKGYKIDTHVDRSVINNIHDEQPLPQHQARFEAEELVLGPVYLADGLVSIEITKKQHDEQLALIKRIEQEIEHAKHVCNQLKDGTFRYSAEFYKNKMGANAFPGFIEKINKELQQDPKWLPKSFSLDSNERFVIWRSEYVEKLKDILHRCTILK